MVHCAAGPALGAEGLEASGHQKGRARLESQHFQHREHLGQAAGPPLGTSWPPGYVALGTLRDARRWVGPNQQQMVLSHILPAKSPPREPSDPELRRVCLCLLCARLLGHRPQGAHRRPAPHRRPMGTLHIGGMDLSCRAPRSWALRRGSPKLFPPAQLASLPTGVDQQA